MSTKKKSSSDFTVTELMLKLRELGLSTSGSKNELIARMDEANSLDKWTTLSEEGDEGDLKVKGAASVLALREKSLCKREKELAEREEEIVRRELELERLRVGEASGGERILPTEDAENGGKVDLGDLKELIKPFDGSFGTYANWERQVKFVKGAYGLTDNEAKVLMITRMRNKVLKWFHSKPEHLELPLDDLLTKMKNFYDQRPERSTNMESKRPQRGTVRCYNCWGLGHLAKNCSQPMEDKTACFQCGETGHGINNCPNKPAITTTAQFTHSHELEKPHDHCLHRKLEYELVHEGEKFRFRLDTLFDSGTAISFIKEKFVLKDAIVRADHRREYYGAHNSELKILGSVRLRVFLVDTSEDELRLFVVDNETIMRSAVVLGRDCSKLKFHVLHPIE